MRSCIRHRGSGAEGTKLSPCRHHSHLPRLSPLLRKIVTSSFLTSQTHLFCAPRAEPRVFPEAEHLTSLMTAGQVARRPWPGTGRCHPLRSGHGSCRGRGEQRVRNKQGEPLALFHPSPLHPFSGKVPQRAAERRKVAGFPPGLAGTCRGAGAAARCGVRPVRGRGRWPGFWRRCE